MTKLTHTCPLLYERLGPGASCHRKRLVVGALGLDVPGLLALVADLLSSRGALRAVAGEVARLATVVTLAAINAVARHMADAATRVARLVLVAKATATAAATTTEGVVSRAAVGSLGAVARDVTDLTALVALGPGLAAAAAAAAGSAARLGTFARYMATLAASVARLGFLGALGAVTTHMALATTVVAFGLAAVGAVTSLVGRGSAGEAGSALEIHLCVCGFCVLSLGFV